MSALTDNKINEVLRTIYRDFIGHEAVSLEPLYSHGSDRDMIRIHSSDNSSVIGIYNENTEENNAFVQFSMHFKSRGSTCLKFYVSNDKRLIDGGFGILPVQKISGDEERFGSKH
jgi:hypothetical protein